MYSCCRGIVDLLQFQQGVAAGPQQPASLGHGSSPSGGMAVCVHTLSDSPHVLAWLPNGGTV